MTFRSYVSDIPRPQGVACLVVVLFNCDQGMKRSCGKYDIRRKKEYKTEVLSG
jgi:hypothetical protein